jgi:hypothetical protein
MEKSLFEHNLKTLSPINNETDPADAGKAVHRWRMYREPRPRRMGLPATVRPP